MKYRTRVGVVSRGSRRGRPASARSRVVTAEALESLRMMSVANTLTSVAYQTPSGAKAAVYAIGTNGSVYADLDDGKGVVNLNFAARQVSAGLDVNGQPEVYALQATASPQSASEVYRYDGDGWVDLHQQAIQISASAPGQAFALNANGLVSSYFGAAWSNLGGAFRQISAGLDPGASTVQTASDVCGIGLFDSLVYANYGPTGWTATGARTATQIDVQEGLVFAVGPLNAASNSNVSLIGADNPYSAGSIYHYAPFPNATQVTVGEDVANSQNFGTTELYVIGPGSAVFASDLNPAHVSLNFGGSAAEIAAPELYSNSLVGLTATGLNGNVVFSISTTGQLLEHQNSAWTTLGTGFALPSALATPFVPNIPMGAGLTNVTVQLDPGNPNLLDVLNGGTLVESASVASVPGLVITGANSAANTVNVNYGNGFFATTVTFTGGTGGSAKNTLNVLDDATAGTRSWALGATSVSTAGTGVSTAPTVNFTNVQVIVLRGRAAGGETFLVQDPTHVVSQLNTAELYVNANDTVNVQGTAYGLLILGTLNAPNQLVNVGSLAPYTGGTLGNINFTLDPTTVSAVNLDDSGDTTARTGTIAAGTYGSISGLGLPAVTNVNLGSVANVTVRTGSNQTVLVTGAAATSATQLELASNDTVNVQGSTGTLGIAGTGTIGRDHVNVGSTAPALGGTLEKVAGTVAVNNMFGLSVDGSGDGSSQLGRITGSAVTGFGMPSSGTVSYSAVTGLTVRGGSGQNTEVVASTGATTTLFPGTSQGCTVNVLATTSPLTINGNAKSDAIGVGSLAPSLGGTLAGIAAPITVTNTSAISTVSLDDSGDAVGHTGVITSTSVTGFGMPATGSVQYTGSQLGSLTVRTADANANASTVAGTSTTTDLYATGAVNVLATTAALNINGGNTVDVITIGSRAPTLGGSLTQIAGAITVTNTSAYSTLTVDDSGDPVARNGTVTGTRITGISNGAINYVGSQLASLTILGPGRGGTLTESGLSTTTKVTGFNV